MVAEPKFIVVAHGMAFGPYDSYEAAFVAYMWCVDRGIKATVMVLNEKEMLS